MNPSRTPSSPFRTTPSSSATGGCVRSGGSSPNADLCGLTPAARAMLATLEAIEAAVDAVVASAWLSSADARRGLGRGSFHQPRDGPDGVFDGGGFNDDDATTRENDALRGAFSAGAVGAPFKTLVVAAGAVDAAAGILRGDAMNFCTGQTLSDNSTVGKPKAPEYADVAREMSLLVERFAPTLSRLVNAEPTAVTPGSPLAFLAERHPHRVPFAAKFKLLQREIRASLGARECFAVPPVVRPGDFAVGSGWRILRHRRQDTGSHRGAAAAAASPARSSVRAGGGLGLMRAGPGPGPGVDSDSLDRRIDRQIAAAAEFRGRFNAAGPDGPDETDDRTTHRGGARGLFPAEVPWVDFVDSPSPAVSNHEPASDVSDQLDGRPARRRRQRVLSRRARKRPRRGSRGVSARRHRAPVRRKPRVVPPVARRRGTSGGGVWYHVDPTCAVGDSPLTWRFVGRFLGLCITSGCHVRMPLVPWLWDQLLHGADGGLARSKDSGYVAGFVDPTDRFVGEKLGEVADRVVVQPRRRRLRSRRADRDRVGRAAGDFADQGGEGEARETRRDDGREVASDGRLDENRREPGRIRAGIRAGRRREEEEDRATYLRALERVLSISPGPHGDAAALRWLDLMAEVEPEFHRSLLDLLRHPIASERNAWAVNMLTFTRDASDDDDAGDDENRREPTRTVELIPGGADVEVTDANKARYVAALARHRATTVRGARPRSEPCD